MDALSIMLNTIAEVLIEWWGVLTLPFWKGMLTMFIIAKYFLKLERNGWWISIAILAGLYAIWSGFINPGVFGWEFS